MSPPAWPSPPPEERPRERLRRLGATALSDAELLALVLGTGRRGEPALALATRVLATYGSARSLLAAGPGELARHTGVARAARIIGASELARRAAATRFDARVRYASSHDVVAALGSRLGDRPEERVVAVLLDARQRPVAEREIAVGGPAACPLGIREVFALAVREGAAAVILVHNHPSGDATPSAEDLRLTHALAEAGRLLDLPLLDHVILTREGFFSFLDAGLLPRSSAPPSALET